MHLTISDTQISLQDDNNALSYTLLTKPDIADYSNLSTRPLVASYHLVKESIWERFVQCTQELEDCCHKDIHHICYFMVLGALYNPLLSSSQAKNILYYGQKEAAPFQNLLQDFMTFLQANSSLVILPEMPFVFSSLANGSWHAVIIDLDACCSLQTICDAMSKIRKGGTVLLYTASDTPTGDVAPLLNHAAKTVFSSSSLYTFTMDTMLCELIYPYTAEAFVLTRTEELFTQLEELKTLTQNMEQGNYHPEDCLYAIEILRQTEAALFSVYDYLENPVLPTYANTLKEAVMDCSIGVCNMADTSVYLDNLRHAAGVFYEAIETEFQC